MRLIRDAASGKRVEALQRLVAHPATPEHEKRSAEKRLKEMGLSPSKYYDVPKPKVSPSTAVWRSKDSPSEAERKRVAYESQQENLKKAQQFEIKAKKHPEGSEEYHRNMVSHHLQMFHATGSDYHDAEAGRHMDLQKQVKEGKKLAPVALPSPVRQQTPQSGQIVIGPRDDRYERTATRGLRSIGRALLQKKGK